MEISEGFFKRLDNLSNGERANIKRELGKSIKNASQKSIAPFYKVFFGKNENLYFFLATCFCFYNKDEHYKRDEFIKCLRKISEESQSDSFDNKIISLLDTEFYNNTDFFILKFSRLIRILKQKGYKPDFVKLLDDLQQWDRSSRYIQRRWARDYFQTIKEENENVN